MASYTEMSPVNSGSGVCDGRHGKRRWGWKISLTFDGFGTGKMSDRRLLTGNEQRAAADDIDAAGAKHAPSV